jgi:hypothetical protein
MRGAQITGVNAVYVTDTAARHYCQAHSAPVTRGMDMHIWMVDYVKGVVTSQTLI